MNSHFTNTGNPVDFPASMKYTVVIRQDGETACLLCATLEEAQQVRQSFINYGKCQEILIEKFKENE